MSWFVFVWFFVFCCFLGGCFCCFFIHPDQLTSDSLSLSFGFDLLFFTCGVRGRFFFFRLFDGPTNKYKYKYIHIFYLWQNIHNIQANEWCSILLLVPDEDLRYILEYMYLPTPPHEQDVTKGQFFKWSLIGVNSQFSFSETGCHI